MSRLRIANGRVYDPINGVDGAVRDVWIEGGKVVAPPADPAGATVIDATGMVVMPGGVDMHCHIAGPKVNVARKMRPEDKRKAPPVRRTAHTRSGTTGAVPSTFATGYLYAGLGYTTAFDAAVPPLGARHAHEELDDTPIIDKGFYVLTGNNHYVMQQLADNEPARLRAYVGWLLGATRGYALKVVNPGGVEAWKSGAGNVHTLDEPVEHFNVTPRQILAGLAQAAADLGLPHPLHIHGNNLGLPGNWPVTLETMKALEGRRGHMAHIQFHSYAGGDADEITFGSAVAKLAAYVNGHPNITVDVGQVVFGETTSMTGDGPLGYYLHNVYHGRKWFSSDTEMESGCGIVPITYRDKSFVHAMQWAIGLEWYLLVDDPWRVAMSTDHPNGGSFQAYPQIIKLLMSRDARTEALKRVHPRVKERTVLADLKREYSLYEIAIITRAGPARLLGLPDKGHLGPGADADVTLYTPSDDIEAMFSMPRCVIKAGRVIVEEGSLRQDCRGATLHVRPDFDEAAIPHIRDWFEKYYTLRFANYPVSDHYLPQGREVPTIKTAT